MPFFTSNQAEIFYTVQGEGPLTLVLTHGAGCDHHFWEPQRAALNQVCKLVLWDVRGHGQSSLPRGRVNHLDFEGDLLALLDHLQLEQVVLGGLSMGGHIALRLAALHPERVLALALIGTPFSSSFTWSEMWTVPFNQFWLNTLPTSTLAEVVSQSMAGQNELARHYLAECIQTMGANRWNRIWAAVTRMESRALLKKITCPTLILEGENDVFVRSQQAYLRQNIADAHHRLIEGAGHLTNWDNPQAVTAALVSLVQIFSQAS